MIATVSCAVIVACGPQKSPPTFVTSHDEYRCTVEFEGPAATAFGANSWSFDLRRQQCPAVIPALGSARVPFAFSATSLRTDMLTFGNPWQVWDNTGFSVGAGNANVIKQSTGDRAVVDGFYEGGMGQSTTANDPTKPATYFDTGRVRVQFAGQGAVTLRTKTWVQRVATNFLPEMLGPTVASTGYPAHFHALPPWRAGACCVSIHMVCERARSGRAIKSALA